jgi:hypothetical protein
VADFTSYNNIFPETLLNFTISIVFLAKLIGWRSLLAGLAVTALSAPLNIYFSKIYSDAQVSSGVIVSERSAYGP